MKNKRMQYLLILTIVFISGILIFPDYISKKITPVSNSNHSYKQELTKEDMTILSTQTPIPIDYSLDTKSIYSFSQGPKAWKKKKKWSGSWANLIIDGNAFGNFGCGFCCMANIYSTLSDYECSPVDIYSYAKEVSAYVPRRGVGAIGWVPMKTTMEDCGISSTLHKKDADYRDFQTQLQNSFAAIVLISSQNDNTYWPNTSGHYVTIWCYDSEDDTVFLTDPGDPKKNRSTISLSLVYDALKTASSYQYLTIDNYDEEQNHWKWNKISEKWIAP